MPKKPPHLQPVAVTKDQIRMLAAFASIVSAALMRRLHDRGLINDEDVDAILADVASSGLGDPGLGEVTELIADELRRQVSARGH